VQKGEILFLLMAALLPEGNKAALRKISGGAEGYLLPMGNKYPSANS
jgi:hypothetical protein